MEWLSKRVVGIAVICYWKSRSYNSLIQHIDTQVSTWSPPSNQHKWLIIFSHHQIRDYSVRKWGFHIPCAVSTRAGSCSIDLYYCFLHSLRFPINHDIHFRWDVQIKVADKEYTGRKTSIETTLSQVDEAWDVIRSSFLCRSCSLFRILARIIDKWQVVVGKILSGRITVRPAKLDYWAAELCM